MGKTTTAGRVGTGVGLTFDFVIAYSGKVTVRVSNAGTGYAEGDRIEIADDRITGADSMTLRVTEVTEKCKVAVNEEMEKLLKADHIKSGDKITYTEGEKIFEGTFKSKAENGTICIAWDYTEEWNHTALNNVLDPKNEADKAIIQKLKKNGEMIDFDPILICKCPYCGTYHNKVFGGCLKMQCGRDHPGNGARHGGCDKLFCSECSGKFVEGHSHASCPTTGRGWDVIGNPLNRDNDGTAA